MHSHSRILHDGILLLLLLPDLSQVVLHHNMHRCLLCDIPDHAIGEDVDPEVSDSESDNVRFTSVLYHTALVSSAVPSDLLLQSSFFLNQWWPTSLFNMPQIPSHLPNYTGSKTT